MISKKLLSLSFIFFLISSQFSGAQNFYIEKTPRKYSAHLGIGPASIYADNGGPYRNFEFPIFPAFSLGLASKISRRTNLRGTFGFQPVSSNLDYIPDLAIQWGEENKAYAFSGNAYTLDLMPEFYLSVYDSHIERPKYNFYGGLGLGIIMVFREQAIAKTNEVQIQDATSTSIYIPIRIGASMGISPHWDLGFEGTLLSTFSDYLDGNEGSNTTNDMLIQGQFFVKRYLSPFPFWKKRPN
ncbi:hypothetical protein KZP23_11840 [Echinicola marina]|uniref:DUF6089 family protein n=1 Tax=Echinicola marina TaxID=2859768 RepID=UPI001CF6EEA9|nr:DUF6089 family protein [Echinicola marina]UCS95652.1 hypothetical protein KZP23_11840 [Echinicola marina]